MLAFLADLRGEFELPKHVFRAKKMETAMKKAKEDGKALGFVYTDETST